MRRYILDRSKNMCDLIDTVKDNLIDFKEQGRNIDEVLLSVYRTLYYRSSQMGMSYIMKPVRDAPIDSTWYSTVMNSWEMSENINPVVITTNPKLYNHIISLNAMAMSVPDSESYYYNYHRLIEKSAIVYDGTELRVMCLENYSPTDDVYVLPMAKEFIEHVIRGVPFENLIWTYRHGVIGCKAPQLAFRIINVT